MLSSALVMSASNNLSFPKTFQEEYMLKAKSLMYKNQSDKFDIYSFDNQKGQYHILYSDISTFIVFRLLTFETFG